MTIASIQSPAVNKPVNPQIASAKVVLKAEGIPFMMTSMSVMNPPTVMRLIAMRALRSPLCCGVGKNRTHAKRMIPRTLAYLSRMGVMKFSSMSWSHEKTRSVVSRRCDASNMLAAIVYRFTVVGLEVCENERTAARKTVRSRRMDSS